MTSIKVAVTPDLRPLARSINRLGPEMKTLMTDVSQRIAEEEALRIRYAAKAAPKQGPTLGDSVKAMRSSVPTVKAGGRGTFRKASKKHGKRARYDQVLFGGEFGSNKAKRFPPRRKDGWWFFPTVKRDTDAIIRAWIDAAQALIRERVG